MNYLFSQRTGFLPGHWHFKGKWNEETEPLVKARCDMREIFAEEM